MNELFTERGIGCYAPIPSCFSFTQEGKQKKKAPASASAP